MTKLPLSERRGLLGTLIEPGDHIALSQVSDQSLTDMLNFIKSHWLEGAVAKQTDSVYQPGQRTGLWSRYRVNLGQEFVIGGYVPSNLGVDTIVVGVYRGKDLTYAARVRDGLVPATRREMFERLKPLTTGKCPFVNLPKKAAGRWGQGLTAEKMKECVWVRPEFVARIDFLEWTGTDHLRQTKYVAMRDDKEPHKVTRESSAHQITSQ